MHSQSSTPTLFVTAEDRRTLDLRVDDAVESMIAVAMEDRSRGIVVTRHSPQLVSVKLSTDVPFGETHAADELR